jgi:hypothetical protein
MSVFEKSFFYQEIVQQAQETVIREERLLSIELVLEIKFGTDGLQLMSKISQISDLDQLKVIRQAIKSVNNLDELRQLI